MKNLDKIFKLPIIKQMKHFVGDKNCERLEKDFESDYISDMETVEQKFIWGVQSCDDLSGRETCLFTMNDLDLIYLKKEGRYILSIETIYRFDSSTGKYGYMESLLDEFTKFMDNNNYRTDYQLNLYQVFTEGININTHFKSIEEAYAAFKMFVNGFCSLQNKENEE